MTAVKRGTTQVIVPRAQASAAHAIETAAAQPRGKDGDTFEVKNNKAASTGPVGSLKRQVAVDAGASGAYFHKVVGPSRTDAHGLRVQGRLPDVSLSASRWQVSGNESDPAIGGGPAAMMTALLKTQPFASAMQSLTHYTTGPLDKPSVYLGGQHGQEADMGLSYDRVYDKAGKAVFTNQHEGADPAELRDPKNQFVYDGASSSLKDGTGAVVATGEAAVKQAMIDQKLAPSFAFRPFWRVSPSEPNTTNWSNPPPSTDPARRAAWAQATNHVGAVPDNAYFYPGEQFAMNVRSTTKGQLRLDIRGNGADSDVPAFGVDLKASSFGKGLAQEFKRVSSIDQKGREKQNVVPTSSMAIGLVWDKTEVLLGAARTPTALSSLGAVQVRGRDLADSSVYDKIFNTDVVDGREIVLIRP